MSSNMSNKFVKKKKEWSINRIFLTAFLLRIFLIFYAQIHDYIFQVRFTDIDYYVFLDAAKLVTKSKSPFDRATYRYTPLLAWILTPTTMVKDFGKFLFCAVDCFTGWLLLQISFSYNNSIFIKTQAKNNVKSNFFEKRLSKSVFGLCLFWLFNPFVAIISARGNADSLVCCAVLLSLYLLCRKNVVLLSAIVHGAIAVHLKIYPIIYLPSIFFYFAHHYHSKSATQKSSVLCKINDCLLNYIGCIFVMTSLLFFCVTIAVCYLIYQEKFLKEFLFYHITRNDIQHNFSPYFYPLYLCLNDSIWTQLLAFGAFIPQIVCIIVFSLKYYDDLPFCWFLTTFSFVAFNKVSTSQYFIWYLCFLPLIYNSIDISLKKAIILIVLWFGAQGIWLFFSYLFEFQGFQTLFFVWVASLFFLVVNCYTIAACINHHNCDIKFGFSPKCEILNDAKKRLLKKKINS